MLVSIPNNNNNNNYHSLLNIDVYYYYYYMQKLITSVTLGVSFLTGFGIELILEKKEKIFILKTLNDLSKLTR